MTDLARLEALLDDEAVARQIAQLEARLPIGVRPRQLRVRSLVLGMLLCQAEHRPAHLSRIHAALVGLGETDRWRLGVTGDWKGRPHLLSYRQVEYTNDRLCAVLAKDDPDGGPSPLVAQLCDALLEASIAEHDRAASTSLAIDWTDIESFSNPPSAKGGRCADPEASWGHRKGGGAAQKSELFFGYYLSLSTMVAEAGVTGETRSAVAELVRQMTLTSCHLDPVPAQVASLEALTASGVVIGDVLAGSGYAHRVPERFALPLRSLGASLVMDLHPHDRGPQGTFAGAVLANGSRSCPATPTALFDLGPLGRGASAEETKAHDQKTAELSRYKLGRITSDDADGYHRVGCPAVMGELRCPLREASMALSFDHPEVLAPPEHGPACCVSQSITVPPGVNAKTAQRHDYPSKAWRVSYARRSGAERSNARIKDPATIDVDKGWCRQMGLVPMTVLLVCALVVRNLAVTDASHEREEDDERRKAAGLAPRRRRRRRQAVADLVGATAHAPPWSRPARRRWRHQMSATLPATGTSTPPAGRCRRAAPRSDCHTPAGRWRRHKREDGGGPNVKTSEWC